MEAQEEEEEKEEEEEGEEKGFNNGSTKGKAGVNQRAFSVNTGNIIAIVITMHGNRIGPTGPTGLIRNIVIVNTTEVIVKMTIITRITIAPDKATIATITTRVIKMPYVLPVATESIQRTKL
jgi:hypothetical protein